MSDVDTGLPLNFDFAKAKVHLLQARSIRNLVKNQRGEIMVIVDKETFEQEVEKSDLPVIVDIWGPQCGPCLALMPSVEKLSGEYDGKIKFCKLNAAENRRLCMKLKVMALLTILFYKGGENVKRLSSQDVSLEAIKAEADNLLA